MKKLRNIQVFLKGSNENYAEINAIVVAIKTEEGFLKLKLQEDDYQWESWLPVTSISQVRFYDIKS